MNLLFTSTCLWTEMSHKRKTLRQVNCLLQSRCSWLRKKGWTGQRLPSVSAGHPGTQGWGLTGQAGRQRWERIIHSPLFFSPNGLELPAWVRIPESMMEDWKRDTCSDSQSCSTLWDPMDCIPPDSSVYGTSQARILEWVAISFSRESSWPRDRTRVSCVSHIGQQVLYHHVHAHLLQSCLTLCNPMGYSPPGSSVHGILQARRLEWVAMPCSRGSSWSKDRAPVSCVSWITGRFFSAEPPGKPERGTGHF